MARAGAARAEAAGDGDRFEFRIFRRRLGAEARILAASAGAGPVEVGLDRYVVLPRPDVGLKLGGGAIELKRRVRTLAGLEQWHPEGALPLPAAADDLEALLGAVGLPPRPGAVLPDVAALAAWFARTQRLAVVAVRKRRRLYYRAGLRAEIGEIVWSGGRLETLAVEGTQPGKVASFVARLGLAEAANTSYPRLLLEGACAVERGPPPR
jgi:hypothetical protein